MAKDVVVGQLGLHHVTTATYLSGVTLAAALQQTVHKFSDSRSSTIGLTLADIGMLVKGVASAAISTVQSTFW